MTSVLVDLRWSQGQPTGIGVYTRELAVALSKHMTVRGLAKPGDRPPVPFEVTVLPNVPNFRFDLLESFMAQRMGWPLITLSRLPILLAHQHAIPMVHDVIPLILPRTQPTLRCFLERKSYPVLKLARTIITVSETSRRDLMQLLSIPADKICVVYDGPPPLHEPVGGVERLMDLGIRGDYVLAVGTLEPRKNLAILIEAFAGPLKDLPLQLVVAGGLGWKYGPILKSMDRLQRDGRLRYLGYVSEADKSLLYRRAVCLAVPSLYEGFGLPILEAMMHGTPAVVSSAPACVEVIGSAGVVLDPRDSAAWGRAIEELWRNPEKRSESGRRGQERARQFTWQRSIAPLLPRLGSTEPAVAA